MSSIYRTPAPITGCAVWAARPSFVLLALLATSFGQPISSHAQDPAPDPYLGVAILTAGAPAPGQPVTIVNNGVRDSGITASSTTGGYSDAVLTPIRDFIRDYSDAAFPYATTGVRNGDGTPAAFGAPVTGTLLDADGNPLTGNGGTFTIQKNGTYTFATSDNVDALVAALGAGQSVQTSVAFTVMGTNTANGVSRASNGQLVVTFTKNPDGTVTRTKGAEYPDDPSCAPACFGSSDRPERDGTVFPDLKAYVTGLLRYTYRGGPGSDVNVINDGTITTAGADSHGIAVTTHGQRGSNGRDASLIPYRDSHPGDPGGRGGAISIEANGTIRTCVPTESGCTGSDRSVGVLAWSLGGDGGTGGDAAFGRNAKAGGPGAGGSPVTVLGHGTIGTGGALSSGILALSQGGNGGAGGSGATFDDAENGATGGAGGTVVVDGSWKIETWGEQSHGIFAKSLGGVAGSGGKGGWTGTSAGGGGLGTWGGSVTVVADGTIQTHGATAHGIYALSEGGHGGKGGAGGSLFYASGGDASAAGSGGTVSVTNGPHGSIETWGQGSHGLFAQSIGGGGGSGGSGEALVGFGGNSASGGDGGSVTVLNEGAIAAHGLYSKGIYAQSIGGGGGDGGPSYAMVSFGGQGSRTSNGASVAVTNTGTITASADAIFAQSIGGAGGNGGSSSGWFSFGGSGGAGGDAGAVTVSSHGNLTTTGFLAHALFAESLGGGGGNGGNSVAAGAFASVSIGGSGTSGGTGDAVSVGVDPTTSAIDPVTGHLSTTGSFSNGIFAQSHGGGGGNAGFAVSVAASFGGGLAVGIGGSGGGGNGAGASTVYFGDQASSITTQGENSVGILAHSVGGGGGTGGFSIAASLAKEFSASISLGGTGGTGGDAGAVTVGSAAHPILGAITTSGAQSYGIIAQSQGGGGGSGGMSIAAGASLSRVDFSIGGKGAGGGRGSTVSLTSGSTVNTLGRDSHGLFAQSIGGGGGAGGFSIAAGVALSGNVSVGLGGSGGTGGNADIVTLVNSGSVTTAGPRSDGAFAQSVGGGGGQGGFTIGAGLSQFSANFAIGGNGGRGGTGAAVNATNSGHITTTGAVSHGLFAESVGGGGGAGGFALSGSISTVGAFDFALGGKGATGGSGGAVTVTNSGTIITGSKGSGTGSYGIFAQSTGGGGGSGGFAGAFSLQFNPQQGANAGFAIGVGGNGGGAGNGDVVTVTNSGVVNTTARGSVGLFAQSIGGGGGDAGFGLDVSLGASAGTNASVGVAIGGKAGGGGNGQAVYVANAGTLTTAGRHSQGLLAQSVGGGGGNGGAAISLDASVGFKTSNSASVSVGGAGGRGGNGQLVSVTNSGAIETSGDSSAGLQAQSVGGGGGNGGLSLAVSLAGPPARTISLSVGGIAGDGGKGGEVDVLGAASGSVITHGTQSNAIEAQSVGGGGGNGGLSAAFAFGFGDFENKTATISAAVGGWAGTGNTGGAVNVGTASDPLRGYVRTEGEESVGIFAQSVGGGGGSGGGSISGSFSGMPAQSGTNVNVSVGVGGHGGSGNHGGDVRVNHNGAIDTWGAGSHGIQAQSVGGGGGVGGSTRAMTMQLSPSISGDSQWSANVSVGGSGAGGGNGGTVTVAHAGNITTRGGGAYGIFAQSVGGGGGSAGNGYLGTPGVAANAIDFVFGRSSFFQSAQFTVGGSQGAYGDGKAVNISNSGAITTYGDGSTGVFAQSVGGGGGVAGGGTAEPGFGGSLLTFAIGGAGGAAGNGGGVSAQIAGSVTTYGIGAMGIFAESLGGGGGVAGSVERGSVFGHDIGWGFAFGRDGGSGGDGASVTVNSTADIWTRGDGSTGIFAHSVGGGGGLLGSMGNNLFSLHPLNFAGSVGGTGSSGTVTVSQTGNITTVGQEADGIFAQSGSGVVSGLKGGVADAVTVTLNAGNIVTTGAKSDAIFAQSLGQKTSGNISVSVANANSVVVGGSGGAAVRFADGNQNTLTTYGILATVDGVGGTTILGGAGDESISNFGAVIGSIDLGAGSNLFANNAGALFVGGDAVKLGAGSLFSNAGTLSLGGVGQLQTTTVIGNFTQTGTPTWVLDIGEVGSSDALAVSGTAQLGTSVTTVDINELSVPRGTGSYTILSAAGGLSGATFNFGTMYGAMPIGKTFAFAASDTRQDLTLLPSAGPFYWTGGNGGDWTTPFVNGVSNWTRTGRSDYVYGTPGDGSDVVITAPGQMSMGADFSIRSITFAGRSSHTLSDTHTLTINGGGVGLAVDGSATLDLNLVLGGNQTWLNNGSLWVNGPVRGSGSDLTIDGKGTTLIGSAIQTGSGSLTKSGAGVLVLRGTNTYSGGTIITSGTLVGDTRSLQRDIVNDAELVFDQAFSGLFSGNISGTGWLVKQNDGGVRLSGVNTYTGGTLVAGGALIGDASSLQGDIHNNAAVVFEQEGTGTYAGGMSGGGSLVKQGSGVLNLTGNSYSFGGATTVDSGTLLVNGILGGTSLLVRGGSLLGGSGLLPSTRIESGGVFAPGNSVGMMHVAGDLTFDPGAIYRIETEAYGLSDLTLVSGQLAATGATLDIQAVGSRRYRPINMYRLFEAGRVVGPFSIVTTSVPYLDSSVQYDGSTVNLTLRRNDVDFRSMGTQGNQTSVAEALNALVRTATGGLASVVNNIYDLPDDRARAAMSSMSGLMYQHSALAGLDAARTFTAAALRRLALVRRGTERVLPAAGFSSVSSALQDPTVFRRSQYGGWMSGIGTGTRYLGGAGDAAADAQTGGFVAGLDATLGRMVTLGISGGGAWPEITLNGSADRTTSSMMHVGAYGRLAHGKTRLDGAVGYSRSNLQTVRNITDGVTSLTADARTHGNGVSAQLEFGQSFEIGRGLEFEPGFGLQLGYLHVDGFTETGGDVLALVVPSRTARSTRLLTGGKAVKSFGSFLNAPLTIEGRAAWAHEFERVSDVGVRFGADPAQNVITISQPSGLRDSAVLGVGLGAQMARGFRLFVDFSGDVGGVRRNWAGTFGFSGSW